MDEHGDVFVYMITPAGREETFLIGSTSMVRAILLATSSEDFGLDNVNDIERIDVIGKIENPVTVDDESVYG